jgi:AhpD family alkylhydroperoxidase
MYDLHNLKKMGTLGKLAPETMAAFQGFEKAALAEGAIPRKYKELMALAVSLTTQCPYCLEVHRKAALAAGATEQELAETTFVAAALRAGAAVTHGTHVIDHG